MLRDLITSFWAQDLVEAELIIADDASVDGTRMLSEMVARIDPRIAYRRNDTNLGFCENLRRAFLWAHGDFLVVLGDDDILLGPHSLERYASVFGDNPDVHYVYSNQIQMDSAMRFDSVYRYFENDAYFGRGTASFENTWLTSILITGMALRRSAALDASFPSSTVLFPQVELVGRLLSRYASYGIADYLVAPRAHADQLGFHANRRQRIVGPEQHGTLEILDMVGKLNQEDSHGPDLDRTARTLARSLATNLPNEKVQGSTRIALNNALRLMRRSPAARRSPSLLLSVLVTIPTPPRTLDWLRSTMKAVIRRRHRREEEWFGSELRRQRARGEEWWTRVGLLSS